MASYKDQLNFNFLYVDKYSFGQGWVYPESRLPYCMLRYITGGSAEFTLDGERYIVEKDDVAYLPQGSVMSCKTIEDNFSFISIRFTTPVFYEGADFLTEYYGFPKKIDGNSEIKQLFDQIHQGVSNHTPARMFYIRGWLMLILANLISEINPEAVVAAYEERAVSAYEFEVKRAEDTYGSMGDDPRISIVVDYIILHPTETYTAERLAALSGIAETTFRRLFKQQTGKTPMEFIRDIRMTTAARKLLVSNERVSDIAYEVGFEDPNHFIRVFKKAFGMTPNQFRKTAIE